VKKWNQLIGTRAHERAHSGRAGWDSQGELSPWSEENQKNRVCWETVEAKEHKDEATEVAKLRDLGWNQERVEERMETREQKADEKSLGIQDTIA
jgi:hypothetical protein